MTGAAPKPRLLDTGLELGAMSALTAEQDALAAAARGIPTVPCCWPVNGRCGYHGKACGHPGKRPIPSKHAATLDLSAIRARYRRLPHAGVKWVLPAGWVAVDVDAKNGGLETVTRWVVEHGPAPRTWADRNGIDAGGHYVYRTPVPFDGVLLLGPGVEAFGSGSELVMPPSLHPSGSRRAWRPGYSPSEIEVAEAPAWLMRKVQAAKAAGHRPRRRGEPLTADEVAEFEGVFSSIGVQSRGRGRGVYRCPFHHDRSPSLSVDWRRGLFKCWAASCDARGSLGTLRRLIDGNISLARGNVA